MTLIRKHGAFCPFITLEVLTKSVCSFSTLPYIEALSVCGTTILVGRILSCGRSCSKVIDNCTIGEYRLRINSLNGLKSQSILIGINREGQVVLTSRILFCTEDEVRIVTGRKNVVCPVTVCSSLVLVLLTLNNNILEGLLPDSCILSILLQSPAICWIPIRIRILSCWLQAKEVTNNCHTVDNNRNNLLNLNSLDHERFLGLVLDVEAVCLQLSSGLVILNSELITRFILRNADLIISNEQVCSTTLLED